MALRFAPRRPSRRLAPFDGETKHKVSWKPYLSEARTLDELPLFGPAGPNDVRDLVLLEPCSQCGTGGTVRAEYRRYANPSAIITRCPNCKRVYWLSKSKYGHYFDLAKQTKAKRGKSLKARDHALFARYSWCCIYHEGTREAREFRLSQLEAAGLVNPAAARNTGIDELQSIVEQSSRALFQVNANNLFGLVADHLIPVWLQTALSAVLTADEKKRIGRDWVVVACGQCNAARNYQLESTDQLLYLYSRFVIMHMGETEIERLQDTVRFVSVLQKIETYKVRAGGVPLTHRSARRAT